MTTESQDLGLSAESSVSHVHHLLEINGSAGI